MLCSGFSKRLKYAFISSVFKVIIAEKPSLARNIVSGIGKMQRHDGYFENETYIVSWAFGHLFGLCDIEDYTKREDKKWTIENLPCFPEKFKFKLKGLGTDKGIEKQFNIIKNLIVNSSKENEIILDPSLL